MSAPTRREAIDLIEVDAQGRRRRVECFAADRLGDAIVRLYERYADLLPDGPARTRAAATARAVAAVLGPFELDRYATAVRASHRVRRPPDPGARVGATERRRSCSVFRAMLEVADDVAQPRRRHPRPASPTRSSCAGRTSAPTASAAVPTSGSSSWLGVFGTDGLLTRIEMLRCRSRRRGARPLRRAERPNRHSRPVRRRVRANAATANAARIDAAIAARDADALPTLLADGSRGRGSHDRRHRTTGQGALRACARC